MSASKTILSSLCVVALAVGVGACGSEPSSPPPGDADASITGTAGLQWEPTDFSLPAEPATVAVTCEAGPAHDLVIGVDGEELSVVECAGGETATGQVDLPAGEYTFWCTIPGHREAGMEGTVTIG